MEPTIKEKLDALIEAGYEIPIRTKTGKRIELGLPIAKSSTDKINKLYNELLADEEWMSESAKLGFDSLEI